MHTWFIFIHIFFQLRGRSLLLQSISALAQTLHSESWWTSDFFCCDFNCFSSFTFHLIAASGLLAGAISPLITFVFLPSPPVSSSLSFPSSHCYYLTLSFELLLSKWKCKILSMSIILLTLELLNCGNWLCHTDLVLKQLTKSSAELLEEGTSSSPAIYQSHRCQNWGRWILLSGQKFCSST